MKPHVFDALVLAGLSPHACPYGLADALRAHAGCEADIQLDHQDAWNLSHADTVRVAQEPAGTDASCIRYTLTTSFLGLTGAVSPLPQETMAALQAAMDETGGEALRALVQKIHHRMLTLLHDGMRRSQIARSLNVHRDDVWSERLLGFLPVGTAPMSAATRLAHFAGLSKPVCNDQDVAAAVCATLHRLGLPAQVVLEPLTGGLCSLADADVWRLGACNSVLGADAVLGDVALQPARALRLIITPAPDQPFTRWQALAQTVVAPLRALCAALLPAAICAEVVCRPSAQEVPVWRLGTGCMPQADGLQGLGQATFLPGAEGMAAIPWFDWSAS